MNTLLKVLLAVAVVVVGIASTAQPQTAGQSQSIGR